MSTVINKYVDPITKESLHYDRDGNLYGAKRNQPVVYKNHGGTYDFVTSWNENSRREREYYDSSYDKVASFVLSIEDFRRLWQKEAGFEQLLRSMGDIRAKKILLLGNGESLKELYFLWLGAKCIYTDLSVQAVKHVRAVFDRSELKRCGFDQNIEFHAVDACQLPFPDESFDIIYGCVFVHHIQNLDKLFSEITRCLKRGGICRFMDQAYSPLWQCLKTTVLKPLKIYTHRKHGISPADLIATERGGYTCEELEWIKRSYGFRKMLYLRVAFFEYLLERGTLKLGGRFLRKLKPTMRALDIWGDKIAGLVQKHGIVLVWGFTK